MTPSSTRRPKGRLLIGALTLALAASAADRATAGPILFGGSATNLTTVPFGTYLALGPTPPPGYSGSWAPVVFLQGTATLKAPTAIPLTPGLLATLPIQVEQLSLTSLPTLFGNPQPNVSVSLAPNTPGNGLGSLGLTLVSSSAPPLVILSSGTFGLTVQASFQPSGGGTPTVLTRSAQFTQEGTAALVLNPGVDLLGPLSFQGAVQGGGINLELKQAKGSGPNGAPEPASLALAGMGAFGGLALAWRRRRKAV